MVLNGWVGAFYRFSEWVMRLAYVNILWILFSLAGIILFGVFPSTISLFAVVRNWVRGETDIPIFKYYWQTFRKEFVKGNILGFLFLFIGIVLYIDLKLFQSLENILYLISYIFVALVIICILSFIFLFPIYVQYDLKKMNYIKLSFFIMLLQPIGAVFMVVGVLGVYYLMMFIPGLIPFFSMSLLAYVVTWISSRIFLRLDSLIQPSLTSGVENK